MLEEQDFLKTLQQLPNSARREVYHATEFDENKSELKKRIQEITENPEIGVSGAYVLKNLEARIGRKIQISP